MAILSIFLGVASIGVLGLMIVMAANSGGGGDINALAMVMTLLSIGLAMAGTACWGVGLDQARGSTGTALAALIANTLALALLFLMSLFGLFMRG